MTSSTNAKHGSKESKRVKKEPKESKPLTKIIVRRLPPKLIKEEFLEAIDPIAEHNYFRFVKADNDLDRKASYSRAYINFTNVQDVFLFKEKFDGYVFIDRYGNESQCLVEYSAYQKIPNVRKETLDTEAETISEDQDFIAYKAKFEKNEIKKETPQTLLDMIVKHKNEKKEKETSTSLLNFIKQKTIEKQKNQEKLKKKRTEERQKAFNRKDLQEKCLITKTCLNLVFDRV